MKDAQHVGLGVVGPPQLAHTVDQGCIAVSADLFGREVPFAELLLEGSFAVCVCFVSFPQFIGGKKECRATAGYCIVLLHCTAHENFRQGVRVRGTHLGVKLWWIRMWSISSSMDLFWTT